MPTFLRSLIVYISAASSIHPVAKTRLRLTCCRRYRSFVVWGPFLAFLSSMDVQAVNAHDTLCLTSPAAISSPSKPYKKRILMLRRNETPDGSRFTLMSDSPLDDYKSFAEGERICVMIPQAAFVSVHRDESGRGFADMRIEERDNGVMLSFRLQQGASVAVNQNFNRLDVVFSTNERARSNELK
jgi:hypothetical protein